MQRSRLDWGSQEKSGSKTSTSIRQFTMKSLWAELKGKDEVDFQTARIHNIRNQALQAYLFQCYCVGRMKTKRIQKSVLKSPREANPSIKKENRIFMEIRAGEVSRKDMTDQFIVSNQDNQRTYIDPNIRTIIRTFSYRQYKPQELIPLIKKLQQNNIFSSYEALIGIHKLEAHLLNNQNYLDILGTGIVSTLSDVITDQAHPYLQLKAALILSRILYRTQPAHIVVYFNQQTIHPQSLYVLLNSSTPYGINAGLILCRDLLRRQYPVHFNDRNMELLDSLERLLKRKQDKIKTSLVISLLLCYQLQLSGQTRKFNQRFFYLLIEVIRLEIIRRSMDEGVITSIANWMSEKYRLRKICSMAMKDNSEHQPQVLRLIKFLFSFSLSSPRFGCKAWCTFFTSFMSLQQGLLILSQLNIDANIQNRLLVLDNTEFKAQLINSYVRLIYYSSNDKIQQYIQRDQIFTVFQRLYQRSLKKTIKLLNGQVLTLLGISMRYDLSEVLIQHQLLERYIHSCGNYDCSTARTSLRYLKYHLSKMASKSQLTEQYTKFARQVAREYNINRIQRMLRQNYLGGIEQLKAYYTQLKQKFQAPKPQDKSEQQDLMVDEIAEVGNDKEELPDNSGKMVGQDFDEKVGKSNSVAAFLSQEQQVKDTVVLNTVPIQAIVINDEQDLQEDPSGFRTSKRSSTRKRMTNYIYS